MNILHTIKPKSDQLNADDLLAGPRTIKITSVKERGTKEQPIAIHFDGDEGKPWLPCLSMRRVLVVAWGADASAFVGRRVTLFNDGGVTWAGQKVGGIRISHLSDMPSDLELALSLAKTQRKRILIKLLPQEQHPQTLAVNTDAAQKWADEFLAKAMAAQNVESLDNLIAANKPALEKLARTKPDLHQTLADATEQMRQQLSA